MGLRVRVSVRVRVRVKVRVRVTFMVRNSAPSQDNVRPTNVPVCFG